nr:hypothetical protein [Tanacetum cinerariifolium]
RKQKPRRKQREETEVTHTESQAEEHIPTPSHDPLPNAKIKMLKKRVKKLKGKKKKRTHGLKRLYKVGLSARVESSEDKEGLGAQEDASKQGRIAEIDATEDVTTGENIEQDAITLMEIKATKPKAKGVTIQEPSEFRTTSPSQPLQAKDKGKGIMDDVHATIDADRQLAEQNQAQEREQLSIEERSKLLGELIKSRRKYFATKRAKEIWNKPPTKAQQKSLMCTYMKNMEGFKQKDFKGKSFDKIKKMFDKVYKRVNNFVDMNTKNVEESLKKTQAEVTKGNSKRAGQELEQERVKKHKVDEQVQAKVADDDTAELKRCLEIVPKDRDDVAIEATPISSKSPTIRGVTVLVVKPCNKTPYELFHGRTPALSFMKPFGCPVTILNSLDHLGSGPDWLFDIDALTKIINYEPVTVGTQSNGFADPKSSQDDGFQPSSGSEKKGDEDPSKGNINTFNFSSDHEDDDEEADMNNMDTTIQVSHVPTIRIHKDHPVDQVIEDLHSTT